MKKINEEKFTKCSLTEKERKCLRWFIEEALWSNEWMFSDVVVKDFANYLKEDIKVVRGYIGSLCKKEYLYIEDEYYNTVYLGDKGIDLYTDEYREKYEHI